MAHKMGVINGAKISANTYRRREHNTRKAAERTCGDIYGDALEGWGIVTSGDIPPAGEDRTTDDFPMSSILSNFILTAFINP
jgi:hypothetical protein